MKKIGVKIRNSGFARWCRSLPKQFKIKIGYRKDDPFIEKEFNKKVHSKNTKT